MSERPQGPRVATWLVDHAVVALAISLLVTTLLAWGLPRLRLDVSNESNFVEGDPTILEYQAFLDTFGSDETIYLLLEVPDAFAAPHLERLLALGKALQALPFVQDIRSPLHTAYAANVQDVTLIRSVAQAAPQTVAERAAERERVLAYRPFQGLLIDARGATVGFVVRIDKHDDPAYRARVALALDQLLADPRWADYPHAAVGVPLNMTRFTELLGRELGRVLLTGLGVMALVLALLFRSLRAVVGPWLVILATLAATLGVSGHLGLPLSLNSSILVTLILCVGIADCMHVLAAFQRLLRELEPREAFVRAVGETWAPCLLTSLTSAAGFLSLLTSQLAPVRNLGLLASVSCLLAYLLMLGMLPFFALGWRAPAPGSKRDEPDLTERLLLRLSRFIERRYRPLLVVLTLVTALLAAGLTRVRVDNDFLSNLPEGSRLRRDIEFVQARMGGAVDVQIIIDSGARGGALTPRLLQETADFQRWLRGADPMVCKVEGASDLVEEAYGIFMEAAPRVPDEPDQVAQLTEVFVPSDELERYVSPGDGRRLRISVRCESRGSSHYGRLLRDIEAELRRRFEPLGASASITGMAMLLKRMEDYLISTQLESFLLALVVISALIMLRAGEPRLALISLAPNLVPVLGVVGLMGWLGIHVELTNVLVATVAIGIVVDDTIHFMHGLREEHRAGARTAQAIRSALQRSGRAILFSSLVLVLSFGTYLLSDLKSIRHFGALASLTFVAATLADLLLLPALLLAWPRAGDDGSAGEAPAAEAEPRDEEQQQQPGGLGEERQAPPIADQPEAAEAEHDPGGEPQAQG